MKVGEWLILNWRYGEEFDIGSDLCGQSRRTETDARAHTARKDSARRQ